MNQQYTFPPDPLMKFSELAKYLNLTTQTLRLYVKNDQIPYIRVSDGAIRFRLSDIEGWLKDRVFLPKADS